MLKVIPNCKFQSKYRISSTRLQEYDYASKGLYFITICTAKRIPYFGKIVDKGIELSNIGILADVLWHESKNHSDNIELHEFIVMPNHINGIIEIVYKCRDDACIVSTKNNTVKKDEMAGILPISGSLSRIAGSYKSAVSKHTHRLGYDFKWQTRFHDRIIRNGKEYYRIADYINNNPSNWEQDKLM